VSYVARLIIHRYAMLGILDEERLPGAGMGVLNSPASRRRAEMKGLSGGNASTPMACTG